MFLLERDGQLVGFYGFSGEADLPSLDRMLIDTDLIGTGLGRRMWDAAVETAREEGLRRFAIPADTNAAGF